MEETIGKDSNEGTLEYYYEDHYVGNARATLTKSYFKDLKKQAKEEAKAAKKKAKEENQSTTSNAATTTTTTTEESLMDRWWENYVDSIETIFQPIIGLF